jgi:Arc/MetJ-type ribon-helix-helix transcriptional regulator
MSDKTKEKESISQEAEAETKQERSETEKTEEKKKKLDDFGDQVEKFASKTADSIRKLVEKTLSSRNTVLTIRVNDESNEKINRLVEAGLFNSRSESAAFLIQAGIKSQKGLFDKIENKILQMEKIKNDLKQIVEDEISSEPE